MSSALGITAAIHHITISLHDNHIWFCRVRGAGKLKSSFSSTALSKMASGDVWARRVFICAAGHHLNFTIASAVVEQVSSPEVNQRGSATLMIEKSFWHHMLATCREWFLALITPKPFGVTLPGSCQSWAMDHFKFQSPGELNPEPVPSY